VKRSGEGDHTVYHTIVFVTDSCGQGRKAGKMSYGDCWISMRTDGTWLQAVSDDEIFELENPVFMRA
jgi:hypothetical protein